MLEQKIVFTQPRYQDINFWNQVEKKDSLVIINEEDSPMADILSSLGIGEPFLVQNFCTCNVSEIESRQRTMRFLMENPKLSSWLILSRSSSPLPGSKPGRAEDQAREFLNYFSESGHTPYWQLVHELLGFLEEADLLPEKLDQFKQTLMLSSGLELAEQKLGLRIKEMIENVSLIEGVIKFKVRVSPCRSDRDRYMVSEIVYDDDQRQKAKVHGFKRFSKSVFDAEREDFHYPSWTYGGPLGWFGIGSLYQKVSRSFQEQKKQDIFSGAVVDHVSDEIVHDLKKGLLQMTNRIVFKGAIAESSEMTVYFSYSSDGLQMRVLSWESNRYDTNHCSFEFARYKGYDKEKISLIEEEQKKYLVGDIDATAKGIETAKLVYEVEWQRPGFFDKMNYFDSPRSDAVHKWYAISNLYQSDFKEVFDALTEHREYFFSHKKVLQDMAHMGSKLSEMAEKIDSPLCWPEIITDGEHVVSFEELTPIHLLKKMSKGQKPVPIRNLPLLNGEIIGLTGSHEGGKTTTTTAIVDLILLAQAGLPVFGKGVRLNPKRLLGIVFLTKGQGSTARTLVEKIVRVIKASKDANPAEVVLIFDELGEGTQETSGDRLGRDVLAGLSSLGVSVIFNTQILSLAQYAKDDLGAQIMKINLKHQLEPGIDGGQMDLLRLRTGLDQELASLASN